ncbi:MAG: polysaccharide deacetylase family protein [Pseudolabrys sp.]|nr:polysaccharide deacetylase family protein [Pseudolabrys sp.]
MDDVVAQGAKGRRLAREFRWPGDRHVAVVLNIAFEGWSDGKAPGIGPMGNPLPNGIFDTNALLWGHYGAVRGIDRLMRVFERNKIRGSVMVSGVFAERIPKTVKSIADAGHEIVAHAYAQEIIPAKFSEEEDRAHIAKTTAALESAIGRKPQGWISPRGTPGAHTARVLSEAGYIWQGDVFDDDRPYIQEFGSKKIVAIPLAMEINDLPHAMRFGRSPRQFIELFDDNLAAALSDQEGAIILDVTAHCHCYGRPAGAWAIEAIAKSVRNRDDVWLTTRDEITAHVLKGSF